MLVIPLIILTLHNFCKTIFSLLQKLFVLYHVAIRPPSRVAQSPVSEERFASTVEKSPPREVVHIAGSLEARLMHFSTAHC